MRIAMIGTGYVGLVSGACFSEFGVEVTCVDKDAAKIERLSRGEMPIYEPGLDHLVASNMAAGRLRFTGDLKTAVAGADAVFIAVGTPSRRGDGHADLSYVFAAAAEIGEALQQNGNERTLVVTKSTVPVGTGRRVERILQKALPAGRFDVASNPEFLREGSAISDFMRPDRVVIGTESEHARTVLRALYRPLYLFETPIVFTTLETAELIKYAANAFLATKITFINEVADLCEAVGADVQDVARGIGLDGRIGGKFLHAGPGFGGSCFPKDCQALVRTAEEMKAPLAIVDTVLRVNDARKRSMARRVVEACGGSVEGLTLAALGLTFKPNTDDMRDSPSLAFLPALSDAGATVRAFDPEGIAEAKKLMPELDYRSDPYEAMDGADALILVTEGAGFLGSHMCERLSARGHDILCADNYFTGRKDNIAHLLQEPNFEAMRHDITFPLYVEVDEIYNLACPASPIHYQFDPVQTTKTSVHGAINVLGLAKRVKAKILQASTSEVYGDPTVHPQRENYWGHVNPVGSRSCYDEGKRCAETLFFDYRRQHNLPIKVARIFNTYGPRMHPNDGRVVSNFIVQALKGEPITVYGTGAQTRSFCYVDDLVEGLIRLMNTPDDFTGPMNIGNANEFTILELAQRVIALTGAKS